MTDIIQAMLSPGLMISACGLLILGMNNKYSGVINRIRVLDDEKRHLGDSKLTPEFSDKQQIRIRCIRKQLACLHKRVWLVKNSVILYTLAVILFIGSSLCIGIDAQFQTSVLESAVLFLFLSGMVIVLLGGLFGIREAHLGYEIIEIEMSEEKNIST